MSTADREIPFGRPWIGEEEKRAVLAVLDGPILTHGPKGHEFEEKFTRYIGGGTSITTSSCMASLHLATMHFGFKPGDEVLVPAQTHVATVHAVELVGATPVFVDCELKTGNVDLADFERKITPKTKGAIIVHFSGIPAKMDRIMEIASARGLKIIEDCALSVGARYKGKHTGLWGDAGCFSFYPVKHITTSEGGMFVSKDAETAKKVAHFRAFSVDRTHTERAIPGFYNVTGVGLNYRMGELQSALGVVQIDRIPEILRRRKENFTRLKAAMLALDCGTVLDSEVPEQENSHYCLSFILGGKWASRRNDLVARLKERKVGTSIYYPQPVPRMQYYKDKYGYDEKRFPNAARISDESIALPVGPHLNVEDMDHIASSFKRALEG
jgi:dTDP-4-amino-4,6-dideoxygalactose transaminase